MKKRFLLTFFAVFLIVGMNVFAEKYEVKFDTVPEKMVIAEYSGKFITDMKVIKIEDNQEKAEFETDAEKFLTHLVFQDTIEIVTANKVTAEEDKVLENTKDYPDVYDKEKYANRAIMLVTSVSNIYKDNEPYVSVGVLFHGEERIFHISKDVLIANTPEAYNDIEGKAVSNLKKGDIINISVMFSGIIADVNLIFRPTFENPILQDTDFGAGFKKMFSDDGVVIGKSDYKAMTPDTGVTNGYGYAFGIISDRTDNELELRDKNGDLLIIDIAEGAIIYEADAQEKFKASTSAISALRKTSGAKEAFDEDGNFLGWKENSKYNYAFVRTIDKDATEVVLYKNY